MGVRQITDLGLIKRVLPIVVVGNFLLISALIFYTSQSLSIFLPQAGAFVGYSLALGKFSSYLLGLITLGLILRNGILQGFEASESKLIPSIALAWSFSAFTTAFFAIANALSLQFSESANLQILFTYGWDIASSRAYLLMALIALLVASAHRTAKRSTPLVTALFGLIALTLPAALSHTGGVSSHQWAVLAGSIHGFSVSLWMASLIGLLLIDRKSVV